MSRTGPIILVDDDSDDQNLLTDALRELGIQNKLIYLDRCDTALQFLRTTKESPLLIICDVNLPRQSGLEFKRHIDQDHQLRQKSIPFIFFTTSADKKAVDIAYKEMTVQGFFQKATSFDELKNIVDVIVKYWQLCRHPNAD